MSKAPEPKRQRRVTLNDVARHAEVSRALVSIVMRGVSGASESTRARVWASARELGYRPDLRARSLAGQKSRLIGVIFGAGVGEFHFELLDGLYAAAARHGHTLILSALTSGRDEAMAAQSLSDFHFDAVIMLTQTPEPLLAGRVPVVVVGWCVDHPEVDVVRTSDEQGMAAAVDHLVDLGHRRIVHLDGGETPIGYSRRSAFSRAMRARGLERQAGIVPGGQSHLDGFRATQRMLEQHPNLPTAIIAYNDDSAVAAMAALALEGIDVPQQMSVVGFDDSRMAALPAADLTSVAQEIPRLAELAMARAVARSEGQPIAEREIVLPARLTVRSSTSRPAVDVA